MEIKECPNIKKRKKGTPSKKKQKKKKNIKHNTVV